MIPENDFEPRLNTLKHLNFFYKILRFFLYFSCGFTILFFLIALASFISDGNSGEPFGLFFGLLLGDIALYGGMVRLSVLLDFYEAIVISRQKVSNEYVDGNHSNKNPNESFFN